MFYVSLPFAVIVLAAAFVAARQHPHPIRWSWFLVCGITPALLCGSTVIARLFVTLLGALIVWHLLRSRIRTFLPLSAVAVAIPYGLVGLQAAKEETRQNRLREEYPFVSLANRVPEPRGHLRTPATGTAAMRLLAFENEIPDNTSVRAAELRDLHNRSVHTFTNNPGFGVMRMMDDRISERALKDQDRDDTPTQPGSPAIWELGEPFELTTNVDRNTLNDLHTSSTHDFVNPLGWGYVQNRERVAGFLPHRFRKVPETQIWLVQRIELVGLLKHSEPVVYLSDKLPAMKELRDAPTRPVDKFETAGLEVIQKGEDGFVARRDDVVRFVGAIRSTKQCVGCHGGERGDLLGAFSYTLRSSSTQPTER